jgi:hypothetical protein
MRAVPELNRLRQAGCGKRCGALVLAFSKECGSHGVGCASTPGDYQDRSARLHAPIRVIEGYLTTIHHDRGRWLIAGSSEAILVSHGDSLPHFVPGTSTTLVWWSSLCGNLR